MVREPSKVVREVKQQPPLVVGARAMLMMVLSRLILCASVAHARSLRVVTYNIHGWRTEQHKDNLQSLIDLLTSLQPDVLCLNEVLHPFVAPAPDDPYWQAVRERRGYGYQVPADCRPDESSPATYVQKLAAALELPHVAFGAAVGDDAEPRPFRKSFFGQVPFGNCILSRHALSDVRHAVLRVGPADLELTDHSVRTEDNLEARGVTSARVTLPGGACVGVCVTHFDHMAEELREIQASELSAHCAKAFRRGANNEVPHIICGDLNSFDRRDMSSAQWNGICELYNKRGMGYVSPDSLVQGVFTGDGYRDAFALRTGGCEPHEPPSTCWTNARLDYVWLSPAAASGPSSLRVLAHSTISSAASDHMPVVCDFEVLSEGDV